MRVWCLVAAATALLLPAVHAQDQGGRQPQGQSQSLAKPYRGAFVCEKQPGSADILHVPGDLVVRGTEVQFARPIFNLRGTRVLGSELGSGSVDSNGSVHVRSDWDFRGIAVRGDYSGTLNATGGALTGTQSWHAPNGEARSRTCQIALVAVDAQPTAAQ